MPPQVIEGDHGSHRQAVGESSKDDLWVLPQEAQLRFPRLRLDRQRNIGLSEVRELPAPHAPDAAPFRVSSGRDQIKGARARILSLHRRHQAESACQ